MLRLRLLPFGLLASPVQCLSASGAVASLSSSPSCSSSLICYDIVILGGGMVGNAMACAAGCSKSVRDKKILLVEAGPKPKSVVNDAVDSEYSNRVSAISPQAIQFFKDLNVWHRLESYRVKPVHHMKVWETCSDSHITFNDEKLRQPLAYIIENNAIIAALVELLDKLNVDVKYQTIAKDIRLPPDGASSGDSASIVLSNEEEVKAKLVIGADGVNSAVRKAMNGHYLSWEYDQKALVATLNLMEDGANETAWQRFTSNGPVALLPLTDSKSSLVWTTTPSECDRLMALPDDQFVDQLNQILWDEREKSPSANLLFGCFSSMMDSITGGRPEELISPPNIVSIATNSRASFPLGFGHANNYVGSRVALIGDAAHRVHPLAGQGVNLGFRDVQCLIRVIETCVKNGADIGSVRTLLSYESERQRGNAPIMFGVDVLNRLYGNSLMPLVALRSLGLAAVNRTKPLKNIFMERAMA